VIILEKESINEVVNEILKIDYKTSKMIKAKDEEIMNLENSYNLLMNNKRKKYREEIDREKRNLRKKIIEDGEKEAKSIIDSCVFEVDELENSYEKDKEKLLKKVFNKIFNK